MPEPYSFTVNGEPRTVHAEADTPLLYVLRNDLKLSGARYGCGVGQCGSCAVIMDGKDINACDTPLWSVAGKTITTIEGIGSRDRPHPLQQAFIDEQAAQCGYCTSGMLMAAAALLRSNPAPTAAEVRTALDANLCRCGSHNRIVRAVLRAAQPASA